MALEAPVPPSGEPPARIRILPPEVAARIAAGEVIEGPASVVKELLENALDAGARRIEVLLEAGGIERIRVRDDGCGIPSDQLPDAFERHATSKLRAAEDLFALRTLGFRGEALAAIVAAADVEVTTRPPLEHAAAVARFRGGLAAPFGAAAAAPGTTVEVRGLFAALPARRRFLREPRAEARAVAGVVADYALARPGVAFQLEGDGRMLLSSPGSGSLEDAVAAVHGAELASGLLPLEYARATEDGMRARVTGAISAPSVHRANRRFLHLVINGRAVSSRTLTAAIEEAYRGLLPGGRHPAGVVIIEVPPGQVDVNVHPRKAEVRLRHERFVAGALHTAVRQALLGAGPASFEGVPRPLERGDASEERSEAPPLDPLASRRLLAAVRPASAHGAHEGYGGLARHAGGTDDREHGPREATPVLGGEGAARGLAPLRALGQVDLAYLVAESSEGVCLVDQHAAHERVLFEQLLEARREGRADSQALLDVALAPLSAAQTLLASMHAVALEEIGWLIEPTDGAALLVRAVPAGLAGRDARRELAEYLDRLEAEERVATPDRAAAALACRAAVRAGDRLDLAQQRALLDALEACEQPQTCPHGRPTMLQLSRDQLHRSFARPERGRAR